MKSVFFSPVFNQLHEFPRVLEELKAIDLPCDEILLVNNGSTDGSEKLVHDSGYPYIDVPENRGVGYATIAAIDWALDRGYDLFGGFASNGKMLPREMDRLVAPLRSGEADFVGGSRFLAEGDSPNLPDFRRMAIPIVTVLARAISGARITDATCGYRAYNLDIFRRAEFDWRARWLWGYAWEPYVYVKILVEPSLRWKEVPITMRYPEKGRRYTKIRPGRDWLQMLYPWVLGRIDGKGFRPVLPAGARNASRG